jgi:hypothetical protein
VTQAGCLRSHLALALVLPCLWLSSTNIAFSIQFHRQLPDNLTHVSEQQAQVGACLPQQLESSWHYLAAACFSRLMAPPCACLEHTHAHSYSVQISILYSLATAACRCSNQAATLHRNLHTGSRASTCSTQNQTPSAVLTGSNCIPPDNVAS